MVLQRLNLFLITLIMLRLGRLRGVCRWQRENVYNWNNVWENGVTYQEGDVVFYNGSDYWCGSNNTTSCNSNPEIDNESWEQGFCAFWEADANPTNYMWAGVSHTYEFENDSAEGTGYYNHMDEALILENISLVGADAAFLDMDAICSADFFFNI